MLENKYFFNLSVDDFTGSLPMYEVDLYEYPNKSELIFNIDLTAANNQLSIYRIRINLAPSSAPSSLYITILCSADTLSTKTVRVFKEAGGASYTSSGDRENTISYSITGVLASVTRANNASPLELTAANSENCAVYGMGDFTQVTPNLTVYTRMPVSSFNGETVPRPIQFYAPLLPGTSGQILKSNGASGGAPSWASSKYYHRVSLAYRDGAKSGTVYLSYIDEYGSATNNLSTTDSIYIGALCNNIYKSALNMPIPTTSYLTETSGSLTYYYLIIFVNSTNLRALKFTSSGGVSWVSLPNFGTDTVSTAQDYAIKAVE